MRRQLKCIQCHHTDLIQCHDNPNSRTDGRRGICSKKLWVGRREKTLTMFTSRAPRQNPKLYYKSKSSVEWLVLAQTYSALTTFHFLSTNACVRCVVGGGRTRPGGKVELSLWWWLVCHSAARITGHKQNAIWKL